jgi:nucleoside phosphorylase
LPVDILIITGLKDELNAVLELGPGGRKNWSNESDANGFPYHLRNFSVPNGHTLNVAASWAGAMGETASTDRSRTLIDHLKPLTLGMCGICAGRRGDVFLGDVILADRVFSYDHGKLIATTGTDGNRIETLFHDIETYNLEKVWAMNAAYFAEDLGAEWRKSLADQRPLSLESQRQWLLRSVYDSQQGGQAPKDRVDRSRLCPDWFRTLKSLEDLKLVEIKAGIIALTDAGKEIALRNRLYYIEGVPLDPPFRVHVGPIASGKTVRQDPDLFRQIATFSRKVLGAEMEAAAIGSVAERSSIPSVIAKAVSDYGDADKDDGFRKFACNASASFLLAFITKYPPRSVVQLRAKEAGSLTAELHEDDVKKVISALLEIGVKLDVPVGSRERSLFYCETHKGERGIGVALNNSGLLAYVSDEPVVRVTTLDQKEAYGVSALETRNEFLRFARIGGPTQGLTPAYENQDELLDLDWKKLRWHAFDRQGKRIALELDCVYLAVRLPTSRGPIFFDDLISVTIAADAGPPVSGPVLSMNEELVGFLIATSQGERHFGYIWPWVSLNKAMMEGRVLPEASPNTESTG